MNQTVQIQFQKSSPADPLLHTLNPGGTIDFNGNFQNLASGTYSVSNINPTGTCIAILDSTFVIPTLANVMAGRGDTITICKGEPFDIFQGLMVDQDLNGTWLGPFSISWSTEVMP